MVKRMAICLIALMFMSSVVGAQSGKGIEVSSIAEVEVKVVNEKGESETRMVDATDAEIVPGSRVIFTNFFRNEGNEPATGVVITNPVPRHMVYKEGTAEGDGTEVTFSVNGGETYDKPENLKVLDSEGKERAAVAADYTHIKWTITSTLSPGDAGSVSFVAIVE